MDSLESDSEILHEILHKYWNIIVIMYLTLVSNYLIKRKPGKPSTTNILSKNIQVELS